MTVQSNFDNNTSMNTHRGFRNDIKTAENKLNPTGPDSNSLLQTSTNIFIYANGSAVGMIQSFTVNESRNINKLQSIGWEGVVQAVPSNTNGGSLNVSRIALYESNLWAALGMTKDGVPYNPLNAKVHNSKKDDKTWDSGYDHKTDSKASNKVSSRAVFKTLKDQRVPFEIQVKTKRSGSSDDYYVETYIDCWLASYSKSYTVQTITVAETATIQYADVY